MRPSLHLTFPTGLRMSTLLRTTHIGCVDRLAPQTRLLEAFFGQVADGVPQVVGSFEAVKRDITSLETQSGLPCGRLVSALVHDVLTGRTEVPVAPRMFVATGGV